MDTLEVFVNVLLPIFLIFGLGYLLGKKKNVEAHSVAHLSIYVLLPALVFTSFLERNVLNSLALTGVFILVFTIVMYILSVVTCKILKYDKNMESAFLLAVLFTNSGNYGVPLCAFAFGEEGMVNALAYMMYGSVIMYTMAVYIASRGTFNARQSLFNIFRIPLIYAVVAACLLSYFEVDVPAFITAPMSLLGSAAIPVAMILLGIQLSRTHVHTDYHPLVLSNIYRLALSPFLGIAITHFMGVEGLLRSVLIIECSMPTAINAALIAIEFDAKPGFVSSAVLTSTVLSIGSLAVLLLYLT